MAHDPKVFDRIASHYDRLVAEHGRSARAADYGDERSPVAKYEVLAEVMPLRGLRVLDVGCGLAGFPELAAPAHGEFHYTGVDISGAMVEGAIAEHPERDVRRANILTEDLGEFDVVLANGIFYLLGQEAEELMRTLIERMWDHARLAVAFNSLSAWASDASADEFHADPLETLDFCRRLTPRVVLRHDYHPRDFSVYMYKAAT